MRRLGWLEQVRKEKTAGITATRAKTIFYSYSCLLRNRMTIFALQSETELRKGGSGSVKQRASGRRREAPYGRDQNKPKGDEC